MDLFFVLLMVVFCLTYGRFGFLAVCFSIRKAYARLNT